MLVTWKHKGVSASASACPLDMAASHLVPRVCEWPIGAVKRYSARSAAFGFARAARQAGAALAASATTSIVPATPAKTHGSVAD